MTVPLRIILRNGSEIVAESQLALGHDPGSQHHRVWATSRPGWYLVEATSDAWNRELHRIVPVRMKNVVSAREVFLQYVLLAGLGMFRTSDDLDDFCPEIAG